MKCHLLAALLFLNGLLLPTGSVQAQEAIDRYIVAKIRDEGLNRSQVHSTFTHFTEEIGPRLTASPAYKAAAEWAQAKLKEWGLANPRLESWEFGRGWTLDKFSIEMIEPRYMPLIGYPEAWSASTAGELTAAPIFLGNKKQDEVEQLRGKLKGAIVMSQPIQKSCCDGVNPIRFCQAAICRFRLKPLAWPRETANL
ncbi:MAG TPA: hypothetical protein VGB07_29845 [Blastocatellia bacterium]